MREEDAYREDQALKEECRNYNPEPMKKDYKSERK